MICPRRIAGCLLGASLVAGCSGIKTYPDTLEKNLHITTEAASGSAFSRMRVALHIHQVDANCRTEYQGTVQLNEPSDQIGVPSDRLSYLVFSFSSATFLGGSGSSISYETLLWPRAGHAYDARASYADSIYHVEIRETDPRRSAGREIERRGLDDCRR